jgi:hypothetical protein
MVAGTRSARGCSRPVRDEWVSPREAFRIWSLCGKCRWRAAGQDLGYVRVDHLLAGGYHDRDAVVARCSVSYGPPTTVGPWRTHRDCPNVNSAVSTNGAMYVSCESPADMNPHQSQAFILDVSRGAGIGRVHDRYIISPRQVHDRLYQSQSPERRHREPLRHDDAARAESRPARSVARHGAVPVFHSAAAGAHSVTVSVQPRWDGTG